MRVVCYVYTASSSKLDVLNIWKSMEVNLLNLDRIKVPGISAKIIEQVIKNSPEFIREFGCIITDIVKDNQIDAKDIPQLMTLVQKMYNLVNHKIELDADTVADACGELIKAVIGILVDDKIICVDDNIINLLDTLIDTSIGLIRSPPKKNRCCIKLF